MTMNESWIPSCLRPDFTWPRGKRREISTVTPEIPSIPSEARRVFCGLFHELLYQFSGWYCSWFDIPFDARSAQLPFGVVLKWTDRTSIEEAAAMQMARTGGLPVPEVLSIGEHPYANSNRFFSILMTRLPGTPLTHDFRPCLMFDLEYWGVLRRLKDDFAVIQDWRSPYGQSVCSVLGTSLRSSRVPNDIMGPFLNKDELYDFLLNPASGVYFQTTAAHIQASAQMDKLRERPHRITFTHGDLRAHNVLMHNGNLSGILNWESAGWYPEFWEFVNGMRYKKNCWWRQVVWWIGGCDYCEELEYEGLRF